MTTIDRAPQANPDIPVPLSATGVGARAIAFPAIRPGHRLVPVKIGKPGETVTVWTECPTDWCIGHEGERYGSADDINHQGESAGLNVTPGQAVTAPVEVYLSWWPGSNGVAAQPCLAVDFDSEVAVYGRTAALALVDQISAFAANVRRLAEVLPEVA